MQTIKKICSWLCVISLLTCTVSVSADVVDSIDVVNSILSISGKININDTWLSDYAADGLFNEFPPIVTLIVLNPGKTLDDFKNSNTENYLQIVNYIAVTVASADGSYSFVNRIQGETGDYTALIRSRFLNRDVTRTFHLENNLASQFNEIKNTQNAQSLQAFLEEESTALGINLYGYYQLKQIGKDNLVIAALLNSGDFTTIAKIQEAFDLAVTRSIFSTIESPQALYQFIIDKYTDEIIEYPILTFLNETCTEEVRTSIISHFLGTNFQDKDTFMKDVAKKTLVEYIKNIVYWGNIVDVLNKAPFGFSEEYLGKYNKLKDKNAVLKEMFNQTRNASDVDSIYSVFADLVDKQIKAESNEEPKKSSPKSTGGPGQIRISQPVATTSDVVATPGKEAVPIDRDKKFKDIDNVPWAKEAIIALADAEIIKGVSEDAFMPSEEITREQLLYMCMKGLRFTGVGQKAEFSDVSENDWFYGAVAAAYQKKIVLGYDDGRFGIGESIKRQDMAVILYRCAQAKGIELPSYNGVIFKDADKIAGYAKNSIDALSSSKIVNGTENGEFLPDKTLTRAEGAKAVYEFLKYCNALQ